MNGNEKELAGRVILITGASSGVGKHLALMLAQRGAAVACCARRVDKLHDLVTQIMAQGGSACAVPCDVTDHASIVAAFAVAEERLGPIDSVICNAGINHAGPAIKLSAESLDAILSVNLRGAFLTAQEGARRIIANDIAATRRRVIFIASILGTKPLAGAAVYGATKAGVILMAKTLALEWARRGITVNTICPGFMPTEIIDDWFETPGGKADMARWPNKDFMPVEKLDPAILFLLSEASASITGNAIIVDEGQSLA